MNKTHKGVIEAWLNQSAWQRCHETEELKPGDMIFWAKDCKSMKKVTKLRNWKQATSWLEPSLLFTVHWTSVCQGDCCSASKCRTSRTWSNVLRSRCIGFTHLASQMCHQRQAYHAMLEKLSPSLKLKASFAGFRLFMSTEQVCDTGEGGGKAAIRMSKVWFSIYNMFTHSVHKQVPVRRKGRESLQNQRGRTTWS